MRSDPTRDQNALTSGLIKQQGTGISSAASNETSNTDQNISSIAINTIGSPDNENNQPSSLKGRITIFGTNLAKGLKDIANVISEFFKKIFGTTTSEENNPKLINKNKIQTNQLQRKVNEMLLPIGQANREETLKLLKNLQKEDLGSKGFGSAAMTSYVNNLLNEYTASDPKYILDLSNPDKNNPTADIGYQIRADVIDRGAITIKTGENSEETFPMLGEAESKTKAGFEKMENMHTTMSKLLKKSNNKLTGDQIKSAVHEAIICLTQGIFAHTTNSIIFANAKNIEQSEKMINTPQSKLPSSVEVKDGKINIIRYHEVIPLIKSKHFKKPIKLSFTTTIDPKIPRGKEQSRGNITSEWDNQYTNKNIRIAEEERITVSEVSVK